MAIAVLNSLLKLCEQDIKDTLKKARQKCFKTEHGKQITFEVWVLLAVFVR